MNKKRVLIFNHFAVPPGYPGGTRHAELFGKLTGWEFLIVASRLNLTTGKPQVAPRGFRLVPVIPYRGNGMSRIVNWGSYAVAATIVGMAEPKIDTVYASSPHLFAALAGWLVARIRRARLILEIRDLWPQVLIDMRHISEHSLLYHVLLAIERFIYKRADMIVVMAPGTQTHLQDMGVSAEKICYIPNAADSESFVPSDTRERLRERYGFEKTTAVYAGAHGPANGLDKLLIAAKEVQDLDMEIVLVGDGVEKSALVESANTQSLSNVRFLDPVPKTEIADLLAAADIGLHVLADVETFRQSVSPNKVFDYLAAGLPILTNCPGFVEGIVNDARAGIAVAPNYLEQGLREIFDSEPSRIDEYRLAGPRWTKANSRSEMSVRLLNLMETRRL